MGLEIRWFVSFCLLIVPIAITLGILFPLQFRYRSTGGSGSFLGDGGYMPGGSSYPKNNDIVRETTCAKSVGFGELRTWENQKYTLNPNQWGLKDTERSGMCMSALFHNNGSYANKDSSKDNAAPKFQVTWQYDPVKPDATGKINNNVHAFPNIKVDDKFPLAFNAMKQLLVDFEWKYVFGNDNSSESGISEFVGKNVNTNVAIDLFSDSDKKKSGDSEMAGYEIMVWFARFGAETQVIGEKKGSKKSLSLTDKNTNQDITLYVRQKYLSAGCHGHLCPVEILLTLQRSQLYEDHHPNPDINQYVMTWKASTTVQKFHGDIFPLIDYIIQSGASNRPTTGDYLGSFSMGSEAYDAPQNVTFYVPDFAVTVA